MARKARPDAAKVGAWRAALGAVAAVRARLEDELVRERGLPLLSYEALLHLNGSPGNAARMQDLARALHIGKSGATQLVDRLGSEGLVKRAVCPTDRRGLLAVLTPEGKRAFRRAAGVALRGVQSHFGAHLTASEAQVISRALERVSAASEAGLTATETPAASGARSGQGSGSIPHC